MAPIICVQPYPVSDFLTPCGNWNGHVGSTSTGFREVHGGFVYGRSEPDTEGERILEYALAYNIVLSWQHLLQGTG